MPTSVIIAATIAAGASAATGLIVAGSIAFAAVAAAALTAAIAAGVTYLLTPRPAVGSSNASTRSLVRRAVSPARYVLGEARTGGVLMFAKVDPEDKTSLHMAIAITEGDMEDVSAWWVGGEYVRTTKTAMTLSGNRVLRFAGTDEFEHQFLAFVYMDARNPAAAAKNGQTLRAVFPADWTEQHALPMAWAHVMLTSAIDDRNQDGVSDRTRRIYTGATPSTARLRVSNEHKWRSAHEPVELLCKGMRITWPGQATPAWTNNAAAIRYWYDTVIRGRTIDPVAFRQALAICGSSAATNAAPQLVVVAATTDVAAGESVTIGIRLSAAVSGGGSARVQVYNAHPQLRTSGDRVKNVSFPGTTQWTFNARPPLDGDYTDTTGQITWVAEGFAAHSVEVRIRVTEPAE